MLFVGDDWAEDHHDIEVQGEDGRVLARRRLPEGVAGIAALHALVADHVDRDDPPERVLVGIETDRGPWVQALIAAGYQVFCINPAQSAQYRGRHSTSGRSPIRAMRTCSRRSSAWTVPATGRSPGTPRTPRRCGCWPGPISR